MNPRRVHELMRQHFPEVKAASRDWIVVADEHGLRTGVVREMINEYIPAESVLVEVARKLGDFLTVDAALEFLSKHVGQAEIRVTDREFTGFLVIAVNGVATGWTHTEGMASK